MKRNFISVLFASAIAVGLLAGYGSFGASATAEAADTTAAADTEAADVSGETEDASSTAEFESPWEEGTAVYVHVTAKAGGSTDLYTRYLTQALAEVCPGVNFVVNNYDTSEIAVQTVLNSDPDGLNLVTCHGGNIIQYLSGSSDVNIKDDLSVVALLNQGSPQAIISNPGSEYTNFSELADYIKANPGTLTVGCSLGGTTQVLFTSLMDALTDGHPEYVYYVQCANEADKLTNVAAGSVNIANCVIPNAVSYDSDNKLTVLGTLGPKVATLESISELTDTDLGEKYATTVEQGFDVTWDSNYYVLAAPGITDDLAEEINAAIYAAEQQQSFIDGNKQMATYADPYDLASSREALENEWEMMEELVTSMGLNIR